VCRSWLAALVVSTAVVGCGIGREAHAEPVEFTLDREFTVNGGQDAVISDHDLRLRFSDVLEDSRCPTEVECFWTGQARIAVTAEPAGSSDTTVTFNTNPAPGQSIQTARVADYTITMTSLDPYPRSPDNPISFEDYRATLLVHKDS
jgi:hypothetical protein